jgi:nucleoid-associated protein YgaU
MGFFDFVKTAGDKAAETATKTEEVSQDRLNQLRAKNINKELAALDIDGEQVNVSVDGETVVLTGSAPNQEAMEKMVLCAGNQFGIGQVDCRLEVDAPNPPVTEASNDAPAPAVAPTASVGTVFYTVKSGDTLGGIAAAHYGDAGKYPIIFEANQPMLKDPDKIYPGQSLRIPAL